MNTLDFREKACPIPVMGTKQYLDENKGCQDLAVQVDNMAAVENVRRFLENSGFSVSVSGYEGYFMLSGTKTGSESIASEKNIGKSQERGILVIIATDRMGQGDEILGKGLIKNFILTLKEMGSSLWRIVLLNSGVKLTTEGSESIESLIEIEKMGVSILVCGTCLNHYGILDKKKVGETTNMLDVVTSMEAADKVINIS